MTVATVNTFFDGVDVSQLSVWKWTSIHLNLFIGNPAILKKYHGLRKKPHPVRQIIDEYDPDVMVINEVTRSPWGSESMKILEEKSYHIIKAEDPMNPSKFHRMTLLVTKFPTERVELDVTRFPGGRFCAAKDEGGKIYIGVQGSPFLHRSRITQIKSVFELCKDYRKEDCSVIVAGDFNTDLVGENVALPPSTLHATLPTFPHSSFLRKLQSSKNPLLGPYRRFLHLGQGRRPLDHIIASDNYSLEKVEEVETSSYHSALVASFT